MDQCGLHESSEDFPAFRSEGLAIGKPKSFKVTGGDEVKGRRVYDAHDRLLNLFTQSLGIKLNRGQATQRHGRIHYSTG